MEISATEFKAKCLAIIDQVHDSGEPVVITKRGSVVARLIADGDVDEKPWLNLRGSGRFIGDPFKPVVVESEIEVLK